MNKGSTIKLPPEIQKQIDDATAKAQFLTNQIVDLNNRISEKTNENGRLSVENETLTVENTRIRGEYDKASKDMDWMRGECDAKRADLDKVNNDIRDAQKVLSDLKDQSEAERVKVGQYVERQRNLDIDHEKSKKEMAAEISAWQQKKNQIIEFLTNVLR